MTRSVLCRPLSHGYTAGTTSVILIVVLFGRKFSANGLIASFKGICPAIPLKMQVPVGRVGIDSSVILST